MAQVHEGELELRSGQEVLREYRWNTRLARHFFCGERGIYTFHRERAAPDHYGVNVFCLAGSDHSAIPVRATEGMTMTVTPLIRARNGRDPGSSQADAGPACHRGGNDSASRRLRSGNS